MRRFGQDPLLTHCRRSVRRARLEHHNEGTRRAIEWRQAGVGLGGAATPSASRLFAPPAAGGFYPARDAPLAGVVA